MRGNTPSPRTTTGDPRGVGGGSRDLNAAMSTCAGCGVALDRSGGKGCRECPNCKAGESVEGRHFYCSNKCFTSSWKVHRKLHVRTRRTITMDTGESMQDEAHDDKFIADFGFLTEEEWRAFQLSPEFAAEAELKQKRAVELSSQRISQRNGITPPILYANALESLMELSLNALLDIVCSTKPISLVDALNVLRAVGYTGGFSAHKTAPGKRPSFEAGAFFEIIRRNYLYHVSLLVFHPLNRIIRQTNDEMLLGQLQKYNNDEGRTTAMTLLTQQTLMMSQPMMIFTECFDEEIIYDDELMRITARERQEGRDKASKRLEGTYELGCPMYVCALVATLLHQMWNNRLTIMLIMRGDDRDALGGDDMDALGGTYSFASLRRSTPSSSAVPVVSATSALIVQQTITVEERAKLSAGLMKMLGRKLPSFGNMQRRPRGQLSFREFFKDVNGRGSHEAKKLSNLEEACRWRHPAPRQGPEVDLAAAEALGLTAQLCLGVAAAHGRDKAAHAELLDDGRLVHWALQQWEARGLSENMAHSTGV